MTALNFHLDTPSGRARLATWLAFFMNGLVFALWVLGIPVVRDHLRLSPLLLSLALLAIPVGSLVSMPLSGGWVARWGSARVTWLTSLLLSLGVILPFLAPNLALLMAALFVYGFANGAMDVAMNAQGVSVERRLNRPVMSGFHAGFSFGGLVGGALGSLLTLWGSTQLAQVLGGAVLTALTLSLTRGQLLAQRDEGQEEADSVLPTPTGEGSPDGPPPGAHIGRVLGRSLTLVGVLCFFGMLGEGAVADWSKLYLHDDLGASAALAGVGFTIFSLAMTLSRTFGDRVRASLGDQRTVILGALVAALGLGLGLLFNNPLLASLGFLAFGLGVANVVPVLYGVGGRAGGGPGIARISTIGYLGFMAGPPLVGFIAQHASLRLSLWVVAALTLLIALLAPGILHSLRKPAGRPQGGVPGAGPV